MRYKNRYVIGFDYDYSPVFGVKEYKFYVDPMTYKEANKKIKMLGNGLTKAVYKLVKVKEIKRRK
jgi:hypothetical protein